MRIGLALAMVEGSDKRGRALPRWEHIRAQAVAAEEVGFDLVVVADAVSENGRGYWEGMTLAGAVAAVTESTGVAHSVVNPPYRSAAVVARAAETLDEITGGRYTLGLGAGNTPDDYAMFGIEANPRFSRFAETVEVIHSLIRRGSVDFDGRFEHAHADWWRPRGPRGGALPIVIAAGGPKMIDLTARMGDGWNWWADATGVADHLPAIIARLDQACQEAGRDPATIDRSVDVYSFDPLGQFEDPPPSVHTGRPEEMAASLLALGDLGIHEVRIDIAAPPHLLEESVRAMADVVELVQSA